jgi:hypothetical protein
MLFLIVIWHFYNVVSITTLYDHDFENYEVEFPKDFYDEASIRIDEYDMGAFCDSIVIALLG